VHPKTVFLPQKLCCFAMKSLPREQAVRAEQAYFYAKYATIFLAELWFRNHKSGKAF
jgi:hypothetical protein